MQRIDRRQQSVAKRARFESRITCVHRKSIVMSLVKMLVIMADKLREMKTTNTPVFHSIQKK